MLNLNVNAVQVVSADLRTTLHDAGQTFLNNLRLATNMMETVQGSGMPAAQEHRLMSLFTENFQRATDYQKSLVNTVSHLRVVHRQSNIAEVDLGCPEGFAFFTKGMIVDDATLLQGVVATA
jgi:hypothetical protein